LTTIYLIISANFFEARASENSCLQRLISSVSPFVSGLFWLLIKFLHFSTISLITHTHLKLLQMEAAIFEQHSLASARWKCKVYSKNDSYIH